MPVKPVCFLLGALFFSALHLPAWQWGDVGLVLTIESLYQRNRAANKPDQLYQTFHLSGTYGAFSSGLTMRLKNFHKSESDLTLPRLQFDLYKAFVEYKGKNLRLQAGDFHALLGRGLVLSVLPNEALFREWTIRGGDIEWNSDRWHIRGLGGVVRDETGVKGWNVFGTEAVFRYTNSHRAGWHVGFIDDREENGRGPRLTGSVSLAGGFANDRITYAAEAAFLSYSDDRLPTGRAGFASLTYQRGHWLITLEGKHYRDFSNELNNPPNADREDEPGVLNDATAGRVFLQYALPDPDILLFGNAALIREAGVSGSHFYAGAMIQDLFDRLTLSTSVGVRRLLYPVLRIDANLQLALGGPWSLECSYREKGYRNFDFRFLERDVLLQAAQARWGSVFVQYQYGAQPVMDRRHFFSAGARWNAGSSAHLEVSGGWLRGGEVCAQGQCYYAPPFRGVKISFFAVLR